MRFSLLPMMVTSGPSGPAGRRQRREGLSLRRSLDSLESLPGSWHVRHELVYRRPAPGYVDHLVLGPTGVFLVDHQHWPDPASVVDGQVWRRGRPWPRATRRAELALTHVAAMLDDLALIGPEHVHGVACLSGVGTLEGAAAGVLVTSPDTLLEAITSRPVVLGAEAVAQARQELRFLLRPGSPREV